MWHDTIHNKIKYDVIYSNIILRTEIYVEENTKKLKWKQKIISEQILKLVDWSQILNKETNKQQSYLMNQSSPHCQDLDLHQWTQLVRVSESPIVL